MSPTLFAEGLRGRGSVEMGAPGACLASCSIQHIEAGVRPAAPKVVNRKKGTRT